MKQVWQVLFFQMFLEGFFRRINLISKQKVGKFEIHSFGIGKGQKISKYETENIWNINFSQNTKEQRYPERLHRLGVFMFWQMLLLDLSAVQVLHT